jgi:zinc protease
MVGRSQEGALAGVLMARARWDRTLRFDEDLEKKVEALTPQQISEAFRRHVDLSSMSWVKAGDFKKANVYQP